MSKSTPCPCGSGESYRECCGAYIEGKALPATAQALMRSRYTAYCLGNAGWLRETWHPSTRPATLDLDAKARWLGLKIVGTENGGPDDDRGTVEFVARYKVAGRAFRLHEKSRFCREVGRWYYLDGNLDPGGAPAQGHDVGTQTR